MISSNSTISMAKTGQQWDDGLIEELKAAKHKKISIQLSHGTHSL